MICRILLKLDLSVIIFCIWEALQCSELLAFQLASGCLCRIFDGKEFVQITSTCRYNLHIPWPTPSPQYELYKMFFLQKERKEGREVGVFEVVEVGRSGRYIRQIGYGEVAEVMSQPLPNEPIVMFCCPPDPHGHIWPTPFGSFLLPWSSATTQQSTKSFVSQKF